MQRSERGSPPRIMKTPTTKPANWPGPKERNSSKKIPPHRIAKNTKNTATRFNNTSQLEKGSECV
jgi:hypothetical protein